MDIRIQSVYILHVEEAGDFLFTPSGLVVILENGRFTLYTLKSAHNAYRAALSRHSWEALEEGVTYKEATYRLENVSNLLKQQGWTHASSIPAILNYYHETKPKYFFFLAEYSSTK